MTQPTPAWRQVASMANARAFHNSTILPDGTCSSPAGTMRDGYDVSKSVFAAELFSPATETWQTMSSAVVPRLYHSTALLLPDARVLTAGSGSDGPAVNQTRAEIFSPPYLFKGARPSITSAPSLVQYSTPFAVQTPDAASIASVALIRPGAVTHAFDEDQRFINLSFTANAGTLTIQAPANANLAPPGYYMLFLLNSAGVPSIASFVHFDAPSVDSEAPSTPLDVMGQGAIGSASLTWTASTDNTGVSLYNVHHSTTSGFVPSAANRIGQPTSTSFTHNGATAGTHYYVVTAQDVVGNVSLPSAEVSVLVLADTTAPTVAITAPGDHATVTGSIAVTASASDDVGVVGVQFRARWAGARRRANGRAVFDHVELDDHLEYYAHADGGCARCRRQLDIRVRRCRGLEYGPAPRPAWLPHSASTKAAACRPPMRRDRGTTERFRARRGARPASTAAHCRSTAPARG